MAVFFINECKFKGCGRIFSTLSNLIEHIEAIHIDFNPKVTAEIEDQHLVSIPLSYVLRYSHSKPLHETSSIKARLIQHAAKLASGKHRDRIGHQVEEDSVSESESSNDSNSWQPTKEPTILENAFVSFKYASNRNQSTYMNNKNGIAAALDSKDKPYACTVPGCKKTYKNINGIKYHSKNGHNSFEKYKRLPKKHGSSRKHKERKRLSKLAYNNGILPSTSKAFATSSNHFYGNRDYRDVNQLDFTNSMSSNKSQGEESNAIRVSCLVNSVEMHQSNVSSRNDLAITRPANDLLINPFVRYYNDSN